MGSEIECRLRRLGLARSGPAKIEIWITQADGTLRGPNREHLTDEAFLRLYPDPDGSSGVIVVSATDWGL